MLITLLSQNGIENYSAPNLIICRAGYACARSSWSTFYSDLLLSDASLETHIERNFRHGDGENRRAARLSWVHPTRARGRIDGSHVEDDDPCDVFMTGLRPRVHFCDLL